MTEGETLERLRERAAAVMPELLELNAHEIDPERVPGAAPATTCRLSRKHDAGRGLMVASFGRELKRILLARGCTFIRNGKGDHEIWFSPLSNRNVTVDTANATASPRTAR